MARKTPSRTADQPRIPMPAVDTAQASDLAFLTPSTWKVLTESIFPSAKTAEGILRWMEATLLDPDTGAYRGGPQYLVELAITHEKPRQGADTGSDGRVSLGV